jgi:hypothetical protein
MLDRTWEVGVDALVEPFGPESKGVVKAMTITGGFVSHKGIIPGVVRGMVWYNHSVADLVEGIVHTERIGKS